MNSSLRQKHLESDMTIGSYDIQPALWPESGISTEVDTYFHLRNSAGCSLRHGGIDFATGGSIHVDRYFNLFNLGKWRALCGDMPIHLRLHGRGHFQLTVWAASQDRSRDCIFSEMVALDGEFRLPLGLGQVDHPRVVLYFELTAMSDGRLDDFAWATTTPPRQYPKLVLSVTSYRREVAVATTAERFRRFRTDSGLRDHISMNIVDNGQSIAFASRDGVTIIPNENLGGAGGFARGFIEAERGGATHCLFMDDDASVHMGAVIRTWMMLAYATDPRVAIAGAMINADYRWQIWENGAIFERGCHAQYFGCDLRNFDAVLRMEHETTAPAPRGFYGGWWFFAFPIAQVRHMPFPFFVRGDDVSFSLANDFRIVTLPGVASVQESFTDKASPLTWYLDLRSHLAHHFSLPGKQVSWWKLQRMFLSFYLRTVLRFHYDSLSAVNLAIEDVLRGPQFFADNADMAQRRKEIGALTSTEKWQPADHPPRLRHGRCSRPLRALLLLTLNGHLLPFANLLGTRLVIESAHRENYREVYGARQITYLNAMRTAVYTVHRDRRRFWRESLRLLRNSLKIRKNYTHLHGQWQENYPHLTSMGFWRGKLGLQSGTRDD